MANEAIVDVSVGGAVRARIHVDDEVVLSNNKGTFKVKYSQREALEWRVVGKPSSEFTITLTPRAGTLVMKGKHPITRKIAHVGFVGAGFRYFSVAR